MKRRNFLQRLLSLVAGATLPLPAVALPASEYEHAVYPTAEVWTGKELSIADYDAIAARFTAALVANMSETRLNVMKRLLDES